MKLLIMEKYIFHNYNKYISWDSYLFEKFKIRIINKLFNKYFRFLINIDTIKEWIGIDSIKLRRKFDFTKEKNFNEIVKILSPLS